MTNVGEVTSPGTPSPAPIPCASAVFPAPSGPVSRTRSPARSTDARVRPNARVSSTVDSRVIGSSAPSVNLIEEVQQRRVDDVRALQQGYVTRARYPDERRVR